MTDSDLALTITELSERTGVNPVTLRAWERRYGLLKPMRSSKGYRVYDAEALERALQIVGWVEKGVAISRVRALLDNPNAEQSADCDESVALALAALKACNWRRLEQVFDDWLKHYPLPQLVSPRLSALITQVQQQPAPLALALEKSLSSFVQQKLAGRLLSNLPSRRHPGVLVVSLETDSDLFAISLAALLKACHITATYHLFALSAEQILLLAGAETVAGVAIVVPPAWSNTTLHKHLGATLSSLQKPVWLTGRGRHVSDRGVARLQNLEGDAAAVVLQIASQLEQAS